MGVTITLDYNAIHAIQQAAMDAAKEAIEVLYADLVNSQTMPFDTGDMQNNQTFVTTTETGATLVTGSPQSRRLYYHPEYNFQRGKNPNAGAYWLEPYISGNKNDFVMAEFTEIFKRRSGT